jgi:RecB family endonuclease NucS
MSDLKLFRTEGNKVLEISSKSVELEKSLQTLIETNIEVMLGVRFLASEYATGKTHSGRIDTLGIDENACPVIVEYKRTLNENVMNQGLFYLDWLLDHKARSETVSHRSVRARGSRSDRLEWYATPLRSRRLYPV